MAGSNWFAQLWTGNTPDSLAPIGVPIPFLEGADAGYWAHDTVNVPWARPGDTVRVKIFGKVRVRQIFQSDNSNHLPKSLLGRSFH